MSVNRVVAPPVLAIFCYANQAKAAVITTAWLVPYLAGFSNGVKVGYSATALGSVVGWQLTSAASLASCAWLSANSLVVVAAQP